MRNLIIAASSLFLVGLAAGATPRVGHLLSELARGTTMDALVKGSVPSNAGDLLCATNPGFGLATAFNSASTCGVSGLTSTATITNPTNVPAQTCSNQGVTATGAAVGNHCEVIPPASLAGPGGVAPSCHVFGAGTVELHLCNPTTLTVTPTTGTWTLRTFSP